MVTLKCGSRYACETWSASPEGAATPLTSCGNITCTFRRHEEEYRGERGNSTPEQGVNGHATHAQGLSRLADVQYVRVCREPGLGVRRDARLQHLACRRSWSGQTPAPPFERSRSLSRFDLSAPQSHVCPLRMPSAAKGGGGRAISSPSTNLFASHPRCIPFRALVCRRSLCESASRAGGPCEGSVGETTHPLPAQTLGHFLRRSPLRLFVNFSLTFASDDILTSRPPSDEQRGRWKLQKTAIGAIGRDRQQCKPSAALPRQTWASTMITRHLHPSTLQTALCCTTLRTQ